MSPPYSAAMELWIPITIGAAFCQNLRSALQKHLKDRLSTGGASYARFIFAWPFVILYVAGLHGSGEFVLPTPGVSFAIYAAVGGLAQILATACLVYIFSFRNFAVGTTYSKTETVQAAIFGIVILGDQLTGSALTAILISLVGVIVLSSAQTGMRLGQMFSNLGERSALIGLASGTFFAVSAVAYRAAALSLGGEGFLMQAAFTLVCVLGFQTTVMGVYLIFREPGQFTDVLKSWRVAFWVGVTGALTSMGWFTAMTIQNVAYVRALGQIELVFAFIVAHMIFREKTAKLEIGGIMLVVAGILVLLLG